MNFSQQLSLIKTLVPSGEVDTRMDCPFCSGTNTLTIKRENADLLWYCFHASCSAKGNHEGEMTMEQVYETVVTKEKEKAKEKEFIQPKSFVSIFSTDKCTDYLKKNHCIESYIKGKAEIKVFLLLFSFKQAILQRVPRKYFVRFKLSFEAGG